MTRREPEFTDPLKMMVHLAQQGIRVLIEPAKSPIAFIVTLVSGNFYVEQMFLEEDLSQGHNITRILAEMYRTLCEKRESIDTSDRS